MDELFKNKTRYSEKEYNLFLKSYEKEYGFSDTLYIIFNIGFFSLCLVLAILNKEIFLSVVILIGLLIYIWYKFIRPTKKIKEETQSNKIKNEYTNTFYFYKYYFRVENPEGKAQISYYKIYKVIETKTHFYIYIARNYAFIISKQGFINSKSEDFSQFIKKKTRLKYKTRYDQ